MFWGGATIGGTLLFHCPERIVADEFTGAFSGLLAFSISFMSGTGGKLGWSWIFVRFYITGHSSYNG